MRKRQLTFGQTIRRARLARGLSLEQLGKDVALTRAALSKIELDQVRPLFQTAVFLARALKISIADLADCI